MNMTTLFKSAQNAQPWHRLLQNVWVCICHEQWCILRYIPNTFHLVTHSEKSNVINSSMQRECMSVFLNLGVQCAHKMCLLLSTLELNLKLLF